MKNFIPVLRCERLREMQKYESQGYSIFKRKEYRMVKKISIRYMEKTYEYGVHITQNEFYFFIIRDGANIYLSIKEIYDLIADMDEKSDFVKVLKKQLIQRKKERSSFSCDGMKFYITKPVDCVIEERLKVPNTGMKITVKELFILLMLIQEKSNCMFERSSAVRKKYVNGIIRLLIVLLEEEAEDSLLADLGWKWDSDDKRYQYESIFKKKGRAALKYYLTKAEYSDRLQLKKS